MHALSVVCCAPAQVYFAIKGEYTNLKACSFNAWYVALKHVYKHFAKDKMKRNSPFIARYAPTLCLDNIY